MASLFTRKYLANNCEIVHHSYESGRDDGDLHVLSLGGVISFI